MSDCVHVIEINYANARVLQLYESQPQFFLIFLLCIQFVNSKLLAALGQLPGGTLAAGAPLLSADRQSSKGILL